MPAGVEEHIFYHHLLQKHSAAPSIQTGHELVWPSIFLFFCLILLTLVKMRSFQKVTRIVQSTFSTQILQQLEREDVNTFKFYAVALQLFFILNLSFLVYKINCIYGYVLVEKSLLSQFLFFFGIICLVTGFRALVNRLLVVFTGERKVIWDYINSTSLVNQTFGLLLFPWIILVEFSAFNPLIFISGALIVLAISVLLKWYRGLIMGLVEERIGLLQIFSYFCGLEILPIFVLVKYIIETF